MYAMLHDNSYIEIFALKRGIIECNASKNLCYEFSKMYGVNLRNTHSFKT